MALRPKDTPVQAWPVGQQVTLYITAMTGFLGMLSAPKNENAYVLLVASAVFNWVSKVIRQLRLVLVLVLLQFEVSCEV